MQTLARLLQGLKPSSESRWMQLNPFIDKAHNAEGREMRYYVMAADGAGFDAESLNAVEREAGGRLRFLLLSDWTDDIPAVTKP
jgi:hypothetical protein